MRKQDIVLSGGFGTSTNSARAGFLPISLERAPVGAFESIPIYLRTSASEKGSATAGAKKGAAADPATGDDEEHAFRLYCAEHVRFSQSHRERLMDHNVKFIYIPMAHQGRFRQQTEDHLQQLAEDPSVSISVKSEIIYETSVELVNELLAEPDLIRSSPRLEKVARAVTTLALNDPTAFSHLFAASHHDFYTATHMVNVATWMVPLAYALGTHDTEQLNRICQAGMLHDIGKIYIPAEILNKPGRLSDAEWAAIRAHPERGCEHLQKYDHIQPLILTVTRQHHERLDGTGYPDRLKADQIHDVSKICAVVDSFDAMTAFRPFKEKTMTVTQALDVIMSETPLKYDPKVVDAWIGLLRSAGEQVGLSVGAGAKGEANQRRFPRFPIDCPARAHVLDPVAGGAQERPGIPVVAHNISRAGLGFLSQFPISVGDHVRVYLQGSGTLSGAHEGMTTRCRSYRDGWYESGLVFAAVSDQTGLPNEAAA